MHRIAFFTVVGLGILLALVGFGAPASASSPQEGYEQSLETVDQILLEARQRIPSWHPNPHVRGPNCLGCHPRAPVMKKEICSDCHYAVPGGQYQVPPRLRPGQCTTVFYHPYGPNGPAYYWDRICR